MANAGVILKLVRSSLDTGTSGMRNQVTLIQDGLLTEIMSDKSEAEGGEVWQGDGANNFVAEMAGPIQNEINDLAASLTTFIEMIEAAAASVETEDASLVNNVEALRAECEAIYN
ncbi:MAG: hypothetical protein AAGH46_11205 [Bacteroidota bacterium]